MGHKVKQSLVNSRIDFFYYAFRNVLLVSVPLLIFSIFVFAIPHSSAEISSGADNVQLILSTSCTVNAVVTSEHTVSLNGGQLDNNVGNTKLSAFCNDNNGYSIYAVGSSGDVDGNTDLINTVNESYNIHTGVYNGNNASNPSSWAMKLTPGVGTGSISDLTPPTIMNNYNSYNVVPTNYTLVASRTSGTNMTIDTDITGSYFNTTYNIYASSVQPAGSYEGKVKYVMIHPSREHNNIGFNEAFALSGKSSVGSYYAMQDMDVNIGIMVNVYDETSQTQLIDTRDNKLYWVAKLQDGHCWMTQNLDFDINSNTTLDSTTTDLNVAYDSDTGQYAEYNDGYTESNGVIYYTPVSSATTIDFTGTTITGWKDSRIVPYSANKIDSTETGHASLGNYYNWTVTIASNSSGSLQSDTGGNIQNNPQNSICSKGWRLPTGSYQNADIAKSTNEFARLNYLYNNGSGKTDIGLISAPLYFAQSGIAIGRGTNGYLTSTNFNTNSMRYLWFSPTMVNPNNWGNDYGKATASSVRCVAR